MKDRIEELALHASAQLDGDCTVIVGAITTAVNEALELAAITPKPIDEQIKGQTLRCHQFNNQYTDKAYLLRELSILASLERLKSLDAQPVPETVAWMTEFGRVISAKEKEWAVSKINEGGEFAVTAKAALSYNIKLGVIK